MIIRKLFKLNNAHIVRNCYSERCKYSLHAHTADLEVFFEAMQLDNAGMVMDFGVTKNVFKPFLKMHENACLFWKNDSSEYKDFIKSKTDNWIELTFSPSAEQLSAYFYVYFNSFLSRLKLANNEDPEIKLHKVRYHETRTGWAESNNVDLISIMIDQKRILMINEMSPVVKQKLEKINEELGFNLLGESEIKVEAPTLQVREIK